MHLDYESLRMIWWVLLGALIIGFAIMDGFDLGIGMILHGVARTESQRRVVLNTIGPVWEGNQIWLVLGGGAIFAAWPILYAVSFSGFYFAMLLVLLGLIIRPVGFKYRSKVENTGWRATWDLGLFIAGLVPSLVFGVAMGNVLQGVPFYFDDTMRDFYTGNLFGLLNPFALLCGLVSIAMLIMHGAAFLAIKTEGEVQRRARMFIRIGALVTIVLFAAAGVWVAYGIDGYTITSTVTPNGYSNPLYKTVTTQLGAWMHNYHEYPWFILAPVLGFVGALLALVFSSAKRCILTWISSAMSIGGIITTVGFSIFPFLLPSVTHPNMSLLVWDASSSENTLFIMLVATIIFLPIILIYTSWVYRVMRGKVTDKYIEENNKNVY